MTDLDRLCAIALKARRAMEIVAKKDDWPRDLCGLCYDASCFLRTLAAREGIKTELGTGIGHFFVIFNRDTVIDITSTQFGVADRVAVRPLDLAEKVGEWWQVQRIEAGMPSISGFVQQLAMAEYSKLVEETEVQGTIN